MTTAYTEDVLAAAEAWLLSRDSLTLAVAVEAWVAAGRPDSARAPIAIDALEVARARASATYPALGKTRGSVWQHKEKWRAEVCHNGKRRSLGSHATEAQARAAANRELVRIGRQQSRPARRPVPHGVRFKVLERDGHRCVYCGAAASDRPLHVDHIRPVSAGGSNKIENLATSCEACNLGKSARVDCSHIPHTDLENPLRPG